jgi:hypothetical protein
MKLRGNTVISQKIGVELDVADPGFHTGHRLPQADVRDLEPVSLGLLPLFGMYSER